MRRKKAFGPVFSDEVAKVNFKSGHFKHTIDDSWKDFLLPNFNPGLRIGLQKSFWRSTVFVVATCVLFFGLFLKLFHLQVVEGKQNRDLADGNRIQVKVIYAPRGVIFDRNGHVLAANSPGFRLQDPKLNKGIFITREEALEMEVKQDPRVVSLEVGNIRNYPKGEEVVHVIGFVGQITQDQLKETKFSGYKSGDLVGQSGIESQYEHILKGVDGGEIIEVDAVGKKLRSIRTVTPIAGKDIYLTIDSDLQHQIYGQLSDTLKKTGSCCGAAVASDPGSGQILALVSLPSFNNNLFTKQVDGDNIAKIFTDKNAPVLNRVIGGTYPPGSTFKIVSSFAALQSGKVTPSTVYEDTGQVTLGPYKFTNWYFTQYGKTEGLVNLVKALKRSNDTYYYHIARLIGETSLIDWSKKMKFGSKLDIDLPGEVSGLVPDNNWKLANYNQVWYPGDTLHMAIGQGFVLVTPLQILGLVSFVAADGIFYKPKLMLNNFKPEAILSDMVSKEHLKTVKQGLMEVTKDDGTAWPFFTFPIPTAGKTGTAEFGDSKNRTHAWYTGFAPANNPKIAMTVVVEAGGEGSTVAAPVVKEAFRWFLSPDKNNLIKDL